MTSQRLKITIDTNCAINLLDTSSSTATSFEPLAALIRYAMEAKVEIAATTRVEADLLRDCDETRRETMLRFLNLFPIVGTVARWDVSKWDSGDVNSDDRIDRVTEEIQQILSPGLTPASTRFSNKINDIDHLVGHWLNRRDIFVTDDRGILRRKDQLRQSPGIVVMIPADCLAYIDEIEARAQPRTFPSEAISPDYHSPTLTGQVTFDYSNNDHRFAIGEGHWFFETRWSKASNVSIHAYRESPSIGALALAKGEREIASINVADLDFSSRVRTAHVGDTVVWRNVNGIYAATKILAIKDDTRGNDQDELSFEYVILQGGGTDFSKA